MLYPISGALFNQLKKDYTEIMEFLIKIEYDFPDLQKGSPQILSPKSLMIKKLERERDRIIILTL